MTTKIKINKGWYYSAGQRFGWTKDGLDRRGVGISREALLGNTDLLIELDGTEYGLNCKEAVAFIQKYQSRIAKQGVVLGIISKSLLEETTGKLNI